MSAQIIRNALVTQEEPELGAHIYTYRRHGLYTHHGIYVGEGMVIHLTRTGVDMTCLDCFQQQGKKLHSLRSYAYGQSLLRFTFTRWGTSTMSPIKKSPQEVVNKARELLEGGRFGEYDLLSNNCEHFATFCRTGVKESAQTAWLGACDVKIKKVKLCDLKLLKGLLSSDPNIRGHSGMERKHVIVERT